MVVITEKTYDPLIKGHFILPFGTYDLVSKIIEIGFKLPAFINYDYDQINDSNLRFQAYSKEVRRIMRFSKQRWYLLWRENLDLIKYNQRLFYILDYQILKLIE